MKTRILTALVCVPILVLVLLSNSHVITAAVCLVSLVGIFEFFKATGIGKSSILNILGIAGATLISLRFYIPEEYYVLIFYVFVMLSFFILLQKHKTINISDVSMAIFAMIYIPYFLSFLPQIHNLEQGNLLIWLVFAGAFMTDTCAYFSGVFLGKHKLCPEISPKKTIEGSIGGTLGCILALILCGFLFKTYGDMKINYIKLSILGLLVSVISQMGDLTASIIKRKYGIKDYGKLFPGHGGILDRLDSIITTAPLIYLFLTIFGID